MRNAAHLIRKHGLRMSGFFMFGFPWESKKEMLATADLMEELDPVVAFAYIVTPAPGTELLEIARSMDLVPPDLPLSSFAHTSPDMALTPHIPAEEKTEFLDSILERFSRHNRRSFLRDVLTRPHFYYVTLRDGGILTSPAFFARYLRMLVFG